MFGKIALLMGGPSSERHISLKTGDMVYAALQRKKIKVEKIDTNTNNYISKLMKGNFSIAFIALHGRGGEDGSIQGLLEHLNIPYTGSNILSSALCMNKILCKRLWHSTGLATPPFSVWDKNTNFDRYIELFGLPLCVKPIFEGSSIGVSKVNSVKEFKNACLNARRYGQVMIEPWIIGNEYTVSILANQALPSIQVITSKKFYDYKAKYLEQNTKYICPSPLHEEEEKQLQIIAKKVFNTVGASGWARIDFIRDLNGIFWILEVNTVPGLTAHSLVPIAAKAIGLSFDNLIIKILSLV